MEVVGDKRWTRQLPPLGVQDDLALLLSNLLQEPFQRYAARLVGKAVDDAACRKVEEAIAVLTNVLIGNGPTVQGLDIFIVHGDCSAGVFDDLVPIGENVVARCTVRVVNGIRLAQDRFSIQLNRSVILLVAKRLIPGRLQLGRVNFSSLIKSISILKHPVQGSKQTSSDSCPTVDSSTSGSFSDSSAAFLDSWDKRQFFFFFILLT